MDGNRFLSVMPLVFWEGPKIPVGFLNHPVIVRPLKVLAEDQLPHNVRGLQRFNQNDQMAQEVSAKISAHLPVDGHPYSQLLALELGEVSLLLKHQAGCTGGHANRHWWGIYGCWIHRSSEGQKKFCPYAPAPPVNHLEIGHVNLW